jgi:hypothetical protein
MLVCYCFVVDHMWTYLTNYTPKNLIIVFHHGDSLAERDWKLGFLLSSFFCSVCVCVCVCVCVYVRKGYYSCSTFLDSQFVFFFLVLFYIHAFVSLSLFKHFLCGLQGYRLTCFKACLLLPQSLSHLLRRELANRAFAGMVWAMMVWK